MDPNSDKEVVDSVAIDVAERRERLAEAVSRSLAVDRRQDGSRLRGHHVDVTPSVISTDQQVGDSVRVEIPDRVAARAEVSAQAVDAAVKLGQELLRNAG